MTTSKVNASILEAKKDSKEIILKANVLEANSKLLAKECKLSEFANLSFKDCLSVNALMTKKEKHYLPKGIALKDEKTYRSSNRSKIVIACKKVIKGKYEGTIEDMKAFANFVLAKYGINVKAIDLANFDFASIYSNKEAIEDVRIIVKAIQSQKA